MQPKRFLLLILVLLMTAACEQQVIVLSPTAPPVDTPLPTDTPIPPTPTIVEVFTGGATATFSLPVTATIPPVTLVFPPTATATPCVPRADWTDTYTIQSGDTLFAIASRFNLTTAQLQSANCIQNANNIFAGTSLRVPFTPSPTP